MKTNDFLFAKIRIGRQPAAQQQGTVVLAPVAEQQVVIRPGVAEPVALVSCGAAMGRW